MERKVAQDKKQEVLERIFGVMRGVVSPAWVIKEMQKKQGKKRGGTVKKYAKGGKVKK